MMLSDEQLAAIGATVPAGRDYEKRRDRAIADAAAAALGDPEPVAWSLKSIAASLEWYAQSYEAMARETREGDGRVDCLSVAMDIRKNMIPLAAPPVAPVEPAPFQGLTCLYDGEWAKCDKETCKEEQQCARRNAPRTAEPAEIWAAAQLAPGEGIEDGVARIEAILRQSAPEIVSDELPFGASISSSTSGLNCAAQTPLRQSAPAPEVERVRWTDEFGCKHDISCEHAAELLKKFYDEWPCGLGEIESSIAGHKRQAEQAEATRDKAVNEALEKAALLCDAVRLSLLADRIRALKGTP